MKQHITPEQLNELTDSAKEKLREWWEPKLGDFITDGDWYELLLDEGDENFYSVDKKSKIIIDKAGLYEDAEDPGNNKDAVYNAYPLLSIGQMIEFLNGYNDFWSVTRQEVNMVIGDSQNYEGSFWLSFGSSDGSVEGTKLCDALWKAVKYTLNKYN